MLDIAELLDRAHDEPADFCRHLALQLTCAHGAAGALVAIADGQRSALRVKGVAGAESAAERAEAAEHPLDDLPALAARLFGAPTLVASASLCEPAASSILTGLAGAPTTLHLVLAGVPASTHDRVSAAMAHDAALAARLYLVALQQQRLMARAELVRVANRSRDPSSVLYRAAGLVTELFGVRRCAALLVNPSGASIDVRAVAPRPYRLTLTEHSLARGAGAEDTIVHRVLARGEAEIVASVQNLPEALHDVFPDAEGELLILPLAALQDRDTNLIPGALILGPRAGRRGGDPPGVFLWEDLALLNFYADILSILVRALRDRDEESYRVERILHGAKHMFTSVRANLTLLDRHGLPAALNPKLQFLLPDSITLIDDLASQLERKRLRQLSRIEIDREQFAFYSEVLSATITFGRSLARAIGRSLVVESSDDPGSRRELPLVHSNQQALLTVFRNLVHNSVKYVRRDVEDSWVLVTARFDPATRQIVAEVSDNGIGIPADDLPFVFEDGYRGHNARRVDPGGLGLGLADCRDILDKLGGAIEVATPRRTPRGAASTTLVVRLPIDSRGEELKP